MIRREFLRAGSAGTLSALLPLKSPATPLPELTHSEHLFNIRTFGAAGDGQTNDAPAIDRAIEAASRAGGGVVYFPAGIYGCYTIHLRSHVSLSFSSGTVLLALESTEKEGYDLPGPPQPWAAYQDFGHAHWANSLLYGEDLENVSISGSGLIWGRGLSRGEANELPHAETPRVGNKTIALKNCRNVTLRDFSILMGGHFGVLLTGVDNVVIDGLTIDTNRDGIDIDCCRNVRVANCAVNSPWDDAICPKSSFALGYARTTENVTITNCYVTGAFEYGSLLSGKFTRKTYSEVRKSVGRIKCGTESNGGFKNITVSNCVFEECRGFALESVDGAVIEDICVSNLTMRGLVHSPILLRLGARMRGPKDVQPGSIKRILFSNIVSSGAVATYPSIIAGIGSARIQDVKLDNIYLEQLGGGKDEWKSLQPPERPEGYPEADMFGILPATGFFLRHATNIEMSNIEVSVQTNDARPAIWAHDVCGLDIFRLRVPKNAPAFKLSALRDFRSFGSQHVAEQSHSEIKDLEL